MKVLALRYLRNFPICHRRYGYNKLLNEGMKMEKVENKQKENKEKLA